MYVWRLLKYWKCRLIWEVKNYKNDTYMGLKTACENQKTQDPTGEV